MGLGLPLVPLVFAGMSKVPFRRYITVLCVGQFIWTGALLGIGYFFGDISSRINKDFSLIFVAIFIVVAVLVMHQIKSYLKRKEYNL